MQDDHRARPVERFGYAGRFVQPRLAGVIDEAHNLARKPILYAVHLGAHDAKLFVEVGVVYPQVEAAAAQRVGQVARAVGCQYHEWAALRLDSANLRDRYLKLGERL